jgi:lipid-A-disaccharide synthase
MTKKFFLIAGEASGDVLGSKLIRELKLQEPDSSFVGVGGELMEKEGLTSIFPMNELAVMGFFEVVPHIFKLLRRIRQTAAAIEEINPDFVITIDSPDFCFRVIKKQNSIKNNHKKNPKKIHLIAPSVWAYREGRAEKISKLYDLLLCILPFEPPYFEKYQLKTIFIGHPICENAPDLSLKAERNLEFRAKYQIAESDKLICITPGSRVSEVTRIFPEFIGAANLLFKKFPDLKVAIPLIGKTQELVSEMAKDLKMPYFLIENSEKTSMLFACDFALAKSGTNTIELSLYQIPMLIAYKINSLTHFIVMRMVKIKFANLVNLILNKELIPEMLQDNCEMQKIFNLSEKLIFNQELAQTQIKESLVALKMMGLGDVESPSKKAAREILGL